MIAKECAAPACSAPLPPGRRRFCSDACARRGRAAERSRETPEVAAMTGRMIRALARRVGGDPAEFPAVWALIADAEAASCAAIDAQRARGYSWAEIGAEVGMSKQAIRQWRLRRA